MTGLAELQESMTTFLKDKGLAVLSAWPKERYAPFPQPTVVVKIKQMESTAASFQNYLGEGYDPDLGKWVEHYGQKLRVSFSLLLYSPEQVGEEGCRRLLADLALSLQQGGACGLTVEKWSVGETRFERENGMFCGTAVVVCSAVLLMKRDAFGCFLDFVLKGKLQTPPDPTERMTD